MKQYFFHLVVSSSLEDPTLDSAKFRDLVDGLPDHESENINGQIISMRDFTNKNMVGNIYLTPTFVALILE